MTRDDLPLVESGDPHDMRPRPCIGSSDGRIANVTHTFETCAISGVLLMVDAIDKRSGLSMLCGVVLLLMGTVYLVFATCNAARGMDD